MGQCLVRFNQNFIIQYHNSGPLFIPDSETDLIRVESRSENIYDEEDKPRKYFIPKLELHIFFRVANAIHSSGSTLLFSHIFHTKVEKHIYLN